MPEKVWSPVWLSLKFFSLLLHLKKNQHLIVYVWILLITLPQDSNIKKDKETRIESLGLTDAKAIIYRIDKQQGPIV